MQVFYHSIGFNQDFSAGMHQPELCDANHQCSRTAESSRVGRRAEGMGTDTMR